jgi:hypothetical protein
LLPSADFWRFASKAAPATLLPAWSARDVKFQGDKLNSIHFD